MDDVQSITFCLCLVAQVAQAHSCVISMVVFIVDHFFAGDEELFAKKYGNENTFPRNPLHQSPMAGLSIQANQTLCSQDSFYNMANSDSVAYDAQSRAR